MRVTVLSTVAGDAVPELVIVVDGVISTVQVFVIIKPVEARTVLVGRVQLRVHFSVLGALLAPAGCTMCKYKIPPHFLKR